MGSAWEASKFNVIISLEAWKSGIQMSETSESAWDLIMRKPVQDGETWGFAWDMFQKVMGFKTAWDMFQKVMGFKTE